MWRGTADLYPQIIKTNCVSKYCNFAKLSARLASTFIRAWLCKVTGSSSSSLLGGISDRQTAAFFMLPARYSMANLRFKASINAVSLRMSVFPTERTSIPSDAIPTASSREEEDNGNNQCFNRGIYLDGLWLRVLLCRRYNALFVLFLPADNGIRLRNTQGHFDSHGHLLHSGSVQLLCGTRLAKIVMDSSVFVKTLCAQ